MYVNAEGLEDMERSDENTTRPTKPFARIRIPKCVINIASLIGIMILCTAISMFFRRIGMFESNIIMVYLLGILIFSYLAGGYIYSVAASICGVLLYNFFFTEPYYTLQAYRPDYPVTFLVMFLTGFITSTLTIRVKRETLLAEEREERIKAVYHIGKRLLEVKSIDNLAEVTADEIARRLDANVMVQFFDAAGKSLLRHIEGSDVFSDDKERIVCMEAYQSGNPCGCGTLLFSEAHAYYLPVIGQSGALGVIGISLRNGQGPALSQREFLDTIIPQIVVVLEREKLYEKQQRTQMEVQRERLRADMLRTISHDLRTPLTGIMGLASTVLDNYDSVSDEVKKESLHSIFDDADWLNELVENILGTTRFDEGRVKLNIGREAAEEIVSAAIGHVKKRAPQYRIHVQMPDEIVLLSVDGVLIRQVIVNLLNNCVNYSPEGSDINVRVINGADDVSFEVSDNGPGIAENELPHIFDRFYSGQKTTRGARRSVGLGLSLCKSIVEAHGGEMNARNVEPHGTSITFRIPKKEGPSYAAVDSDYR